jgi:polyphosphate kinase
MNERETELARMHAAGKSAVGGRIIAKMNALEDKDVTEALYRASGAGVKVTLFVRGFCCLRPGVEGMSENITVTSVVGRFLEHSRIFYFGCGHADPVDGQWFMGSADWMYRNLEQRVEAITPVLDKAARAKLKGIFDVLMGDCRHAWDLKPDGRYVLKSVPASIARGDEDCIERLGTFEYMMREAVKAE